MSLHYIWMSTNPHLQNQLRRASEERSAAFYAMARGVRHAFAAVSGAIFEAARWMQRRHRERVAIRQLYELDERMLKDIGLPRSEIRSVARALANSDQAARPLAEVQAEIADASNRTPDESGEAGWRPTVVDGGRVADPAPAIGRRAVSGEPRYSTKRVAGCG